MSTVHNSATKKQPFEAIVPAAEHQASKGPPPRRSDRAAPKSNNTTPAASRVGLSAQHAARAAAQGMLGFPLYGAASKVQLQPGAAAGIAATAAAAALRNHVAAQAAFTAFAAQAARSVQAGHAASVFRQRQQALTTGTEGSTARSATANLSLRGVGQPKLPNTHHNHREGRQQHPGVAGAPSIHSTSFRTCTYSSRSTSHSNNRSVITRRPGGGGGGGHHAGAAYCIIPQPAYHHEHEHRQQQQQQPPPPPPFSSQNNRNISSSSRRRIGPIGGCPKAAATGRTKQPLQKQGQQQKRSSGQATGLATATMMEPAATARTTKAKRRRRAGRGRSSSLTDSNDNGIAEESEHQHHRGLVDGGGGRAGGSDRKQRGSGMSAEIRLERSREQNRQSSKKARIRRKGEEGSLKHEIESLQVGQAASAWEIFVTLIRATCSSLSSIIAGLFVPLLQQSGPRK